MRKNTLTLFAVCATLLWAVAAVWAAAPEPPPAGTRFPATGQTTAYVTGDDGYYQAGSPLSYSDNGNGTITDKNTGLMWEKKDMSGGLHDARSSYPWMGTCSSNGVVCGTDADCGASGGTCIPSGGAQYTIFQWVAQLDANKFAGYSDWRIPNSRELESIVDFAVANPSLDAAFNNNCSSGCSVLTCSCWQPDEFWSSTTFAGSTSDAWYVTSSSGVLGYYLKSRDLSVRAVRTVK